MVVDTTAPRTRRALLAGALGAGVATVASALGRPLPARAGVDGDVVLGVQNYGATTTEIFTDTPEGTAFKGASVTAPGGTTSIGTGILGTTGNGHGVHGKATWLGTGVLGETVGGYGVRGKASGSGTGVSASSVSGRGVEATTDSDSETAVYASADATTGITYGVTAYTRSAAGYGVWARALHEDGGTGVAGIASNGTGVTGNTDAGTGVRGTAKVGTAGYFAVSSPAEGTALRAKGRVRFDNCSGIATISAGANSKTVTPGIDLAGSSAVVATLQGSAGGTTTVHRVIVNGTTNSFTIYLTANSTTNVKVAWHVFG
jgi:hypothetical protein